MFSGLLQGLVKDVLGVDDLDKQAIIAKVYDEVAKRYGENVADAGLEMLAKINEAIENGRICDNDAIGSDRERDIRFGSCGRDCGETIEGRVSNVDAIDRSDSLHGHDSGSCNAKDGTCIEPIETRLPFDGRPYSNINLGGNGCNEVATEYERRSITIPKNPRRDDK